MLQSDGQRSPDLDDRASVAPEGGSGRTRSDPPDSPDSPFSRRQAGLEAVLIAALGAAMSLNNIVPFVVGHFAVDVPHLVAGALLVVVFTGAVLRRRALPDRRLTLFAAGLAAVPLAGLLFPHLPGFSAGAFWRSLVHFAFLLLVFLAIASHRSRRFGAILAALAAAGLSNAALGLWQTFAVPRGLPSGIELANRFVHVQLRGFYVPLWRATALFEEPRWLAMYLLFACCYTFALAARALQAKRRAAAGGWLAALLVLSAGIVATASFGGIPALLVLLAGMAIALVRALRLPALPVAGALLAVLLTGLAVVSRSNEGILWWLRSRVKAETATPLPNTPLTRGFSSAGLYVENARYAVAVWKRSPIFGIGPGQFGPVGSVTGRALGFPEAFTKDGPWVGVAGFLAEYGVAGALLALGLGLVLCGPGCGDRALACLLVAAVILTETFSGFYAQFWTWFPLGIAALARAAPSWPAPAVDSDPPLLE